MRIQRAQFHLSGLHKRSFSAPIFKRNLTNPKGRRQSDFYPRFNWFPLKITKTAHEETLKKVLGTEGKKRWEKIKDEAMRARALSLLINRGMQLDRTWESSQVEVVAGLERFLLEYVEAFEFIQHREKLLNSQFVWRPKGPLDAEEEHHPEQTLLSVAIGVAQIHLTPAMGEAPRDPILQDSSLLRMPRQRKRIHKTQLYNFCRKLCELLQTDPIGFNSVLGSFGIMPIPNLGVVNPERIQKIMDQVKTLLRFFPEPMSLYDLSIYIRLMRNKRKASVLNGAPGRIAVIPIFREFIMTRKTPPPESFVLMLLPVDPKLLEEIQLHDKYFHGEKARYAKFGGEKPIDPYYEIAGFYPGSLVFVRVSIYTTLRQGKEPLRKGFIDGVQSDVSQYRPDIAPAELPRLMIPLAESFLRSMGCHLLYFPTWGTVWNEVRSLISEPKEDEAKTQTPLFKKIEEIYRKPPIGWSSGWVRIHGREYWRKGSGKRN